MLHQRRHQLQLDDDDDATFNNNTNNNELKCTRSGTVQHGKLWNGKCVCYKYGPTVSIAVFLFEMWHSVFDQDEVMLQNMDMASDELEDPFPLLPFTIFWNRLQACCNLQMRTPEIPVQ